MKCIKCSKEKEDKEFYIQRNGKHYHTCKDCLVENIDINNEDDIKSICQIFDIPFFEDEWNDGCEKAMLYQGLDLQKSRKNIIGRYIRLMNLAGYRDFKFEDSDEMNAHRKRQRQQIEATRRFQKEVQKLWQKE